MGGNVAKGFPEGVETRRAVIKGAFEVREGLVEKVTVAGPKSFTEPAQADFLTQRFFPCSYPEGTLQRCFDALIHLVITSIRFLRQSVSRMASSKGVTRGGGGWILAHGAPLSTQHSLPIAGRSTPSELGREIFPH